MRLRIIMPIAVLGLVLSACGAGSHEAAVEEQMDLWGEILDIMEGVDDQESAKEAAKKIEALGEDMGKLAKRMQEMGEPSPEEQKRIEEMMKDREKEFQDRSQKLAMKMMQYPEVMQAFQKAMNSVDEK